MSRKNKNLFFFVLVAVFFLAGCSDMTIDNKTGSAVRVIAYPPGWKNSSSKLLQGDSSEGFSSIVGGSFKVQVLPDQQVREWMSMDIDRARSVLNNPQASPQEVIDAARLLASRTEQESNYFTGNKDKYPSCSGSVEDWGNVIVTVTFDADTKRFGVSCAVQNPQTETSSSQ